jgi:hypothetical protein
MSDVNQELGHRVKVTIGYTRNMGNFESLRVDIGLEADGVGNPNKTFEKVYSWTEGKLLEKVAEVEQELKSTKD